MRPVYFAPRTRPHFYPDYYLPPHHRVTQSLKLVLGGTGPGKTSSLAALLRIGSYPASVVIHLRSQPHSAAGRNGGAGAAGGKATPHCFCQRSSSWQAAHWENIKGLMVAEAKLRQRARWEARASQTLPKLAQSANWPARRRVVGGAPRLPRARGR